MTRFNDTVGEIVESLLRNRSRSLLTGFGVFWGVFMLMLLSGGGDGFKQVLGKNFEGFASNSAFVFAENTSKPYKGFKKDRSWNMVYSDVDRVKSLVPEVAVATPMISFWGKSAVHGDKTYSSILRGIRADYVDIQAPKMRYGRFIDEMDVAAERKVCVIGKRIYENLFPFGGDPCGERIQVDGLWLTIVGVDFCENGINIGGPSTETVVVPLPVVRRVYNTGETIHLLCLTAVDGVAMSEISERIKQVLKRVHYIAPDDKKAVDLFDTQLIFGIIDNLFKGINFLIWLIGLGTILAGAIGVSNIMMVSVKERTSEIGIRRAIGATPTEILGQIISESVLLTFVAGLLGIAFAVLILGGVELAMTKDGILQAEFQVKFGIATLAALLLTVLGAAAGLPPALRAMSIKPVDAMREE